ncbi:biopolymer transporter ExbD [Rhodobacteraceae bacterium 2376]|uniref:Biopolymer transporter ExbD n=1 Tax=Rhabdonatronobacter sediminivivens TaxID=2743469 RepID=A0A7Z0I185_9RHOB|nr:biopolymer transporter ExbD [Rhabdonatronobacter sediminivivens]NYS26071.1 biopolymer transporter ExbD [Rhabdonatronobacter sediminivivens]
MRLQRPPPRAPMETIIAMIDVVFFLLVFFMLIGRMDASAPFEVLPPLGLSGSDLPAGGLIIAVAPDGRQALDGVEMDADAIIATLAARAADEPALPVRVNAHHAAPLSLVLPLLSRLEAAGLRDIGLVVTPNPP